MTYIPGHDFHPKCTANRHHNSYIAVTAALTNTATVEHHHYAWSHEPLQQDDVSWHSSVVIPYIRGISEAVQCVLTPLQIRVCYRLHCTLRRILSKPKDLIPDLQKSGVVYRIPCASCPASYIGQSGWTLEQRIKEHKRAVINADFNSSALAEHAWKSGHPVDWANVKVIDVAPDLQTRIVREAFAIRSTNNVVNRDGGALLREYEGLVDVSSSTVL